MWLTIYFRALALGLIFFYSCCDKEKDPDKLNVLCLGNSITHGAPFHYRYTLWKYFIDAGVKVDFIGTVEDWNEYPSYKGKSFDPDHDGHPGWTANQINSSLNNWLTFYTPDIVLYEIGTNDLWKDEVEFSIGKIKETIIKIKADNPNVKIFVSTAIPLASFNSYSSKGNLWLSQFNADLKALVQNLDTKQMHVTMVDHNSGFTDEDFIEDGVHPNQTGSDKLARNWAIALMLIK
jgi:hypothetical protein